MEIFDSLAEYGLSIRVAAWLLMGLVAYVLGSRVLVPFLARAAERTKWQWDDVLLSTGCVKTLANLLTAIILHTGTGLIRDIPEIWYFYILKFLNLYLIVASYLLVIQFMRGCVLAYENSANQRKIPLKTITQAAAVIFSVLAIILIIGQLTGKSPLFLLSGLGALAAVLMLIFKDAILGLVAGVQLSAHDLVRKGDWIEMPKHNADGFVIDITLTTVRVQNWDKTITSVPAYDLVGSSFKNWRGMFDSGGRRIKRSIFIDLTTIRFLTEAEIENLKSIKLLRDYLTQKRVEIETFNRSLYQESELSTVVNGRRLTNVGTFRAYCTAYLKNHPEIHGDTPGMTFLVRQLQPTPQGLPLELYVFVKDTRWVMYEGVQADVFDHLLASLQQFGLRAYQQPSGSDILALGGGNISPVITGPSGISRN